MGGMNRSTNLCLRTSMQNQDKLIYQKGQFLRQTRQFDNMCLVLAFKKFNVPNDLEKPSTHYSNKVIISKGHFGVFKSNLK